MGYVRGEANKRHKHVSDRWDTVGVKPDRVCRTGPETEQGMVERELHWYLKLANAN